MADWEKVKKGLENCLKGFDCPPECPYLHDCHDLMKPMFVELAKDAYDLLKEQEGTINELQNAYGYLQKQCFEAQDKLLKKQEKKKFLVDSDGNITPLPDVVRCKECKKRGQTVYRTDGAEYIVCWNQGFGIQHPSGWFCADGERQEGR